MTTPGLLPASALALCLALHARAAPPAAPPSTPALLERGQAAYASHCLRCHGPKGEADGPLAAGLKVKPYNLARYQLRAAFVFGAITEGVPGTPMPSFARLSAEERWAIAYHVEGLGPGK